MKEPVGQAGWENTAESWHSGAEQDAAPKADVLIIDVGAQYRMRFYWELAELGIRADMVSYTYDSKNPDEAPVLDVDAIKQNYRAVHITGGGGSVDDGKTPPLPLELLDGSIAVWGNCLGAQLITQAMGGKVGKYDSDGAPLAEYGQRIVTVTKDSQIFDGQQTAAVHMSHGYGILEVPPGFQETSRSGSQVASIESSDGQIVATLFHPEVRDTIGGTEMMRRFLTAAGVEAGHDYDADKALRAELEIQKASIREKLLDGAKIMGFLSGGIDSMVACTIAFEVAKELDRVDSLEFTYVDNGHMRLEDEQAVDYAISQGMPVKKIDASERFFNERVELENTATDQVFTAGPLINESDPEIKRAIQGTVFARIANEIIAEAQAGFGGKVYFIQGSNEADAVSSGRGSSSKIKSHHNIKFMEPLRAAGKLIEPLLNMYKHHIRTLAESYYHMPEDIARRQPFPGPGLGPRIVVNPKGELLPTEPKQQQELNELLADLTNGRIKGFLVRSVAKYVGNKGDTRSLGDGVFLTGPADWKVIDLASSKATDHFADVTRSFYVPDGITYIGGSVTADNRHFTERLRYEEEIKRQLMLETGIDPYVSQHYVASIGVDLDGSRQPSLGLRLFITGDHTDEVRVRRTGKSYETFVDGKAAVAGVNVPELAFVSLLAQLRDRKKYHGKIIYDTTHKPPGSTELE